MGRYANSTITLQFPDLSEDGDDIWVKIRNPKTVPAGKLMPEGDLETGPDGNPTANAARDATYEVMAGLVVDWHVYDATLDDDSAAIALPATAEALHTLPFEIVKRISDEMGAVLAPPQ